MATLNVQNMNSKPVFGFDLRSCIKAPPGKKLVIGDLAQIEARITPYLAGDDKTIQLIADGMNVYQTHAVVSMSWTGGILKEEDPTKYKLAKARVLALGFGCGPAKFKQMAATDKYGNLEMTLAEAKACVKDFRSKNPKIERLWNRLDCDFKASLGGNYEIELPSGRLMSYFDVSTGMRVGKKVDTNDPIEAALGFPTARQSFRARVEMGGPFKWMWGGLLAENLVQATARDVLGDAMIRIEDERPDLTYLLSVHDEVVYLADESDDTAVHDVEELLSVTPDWLPGCPIAAEVKESICYEK